MNKYFVQFTTMNLKGEEWDAMGSDGVFILDGRNSIGNMRLDAMNQAEKLSKFHTFVGYKICKGSFSNNKILAEGRI